jgi:hypothetical protein
MPTHDVASNTRQSLPPQPRGQFVIVQEVVSKGQRKRTRDAPAKALYGTDSVGDFRA